jgi:hypothetical protein
MNDDLVPDLPALDGRANRPDDPRRIRTRDEIGCAMHVEHRDRLAETRPNTVVVDARGHYENQNVVAVEFPDRKCLDQHRGIRRPVPLAADGPAVHFLRHMSERRYFTDFVDVFFAGQNGGSGKIRIHRHQSRCLTHGALPKIERLHRCAGIA